VPRPMDVFMGFVSYYAQRCYQFGINPDVDELERYNKQAKQDGCLHVEQRTIQGDDTSFRMCVACGKAHVLPAPEILDGKRYDSNHREFFR
jgi:hypothetical protein